MSKTDGKILFTAGMHGDEYEVIDCVARVLERHRDNLPPFVFISDMSPSALSSRTRINGENMDLNRQFLPETQSEEVKALMTRLAGQKFTLCVTWHEDVHEDKFYFYDSEDMEGESRLSALRKDLTALGVGLLNGIDDTEDICLGFEFVDGYKVCLPAADGRMTGTFEAWALEQGIAARVHGIEVPGRLSPEMKDKVVEVVFKNLIL